MPSTRSTTSERLVSAARELMSSDGHGVTVDDIVGRAGLAKPTFYAHFASKEALTEAVLRRSVEEFFAALEDELARRDDATERLLAPFDVVAADLPDPDYRGCVCLNAAATFPNPGHVSHRVLRDHDERLADRFAALARVAGAADPDALARQLIVLFDGVKARALVDPTERPARDAKAAARQLLDAARQR